MAHFPKPFFKKARQLWYVEIDRKQHCLGPDKEAAFQQYHALMQARRVGELQRAAAGLNPLVVVLADAFLEWVKKERTIHTFEWHRHRLQRFCQKHPQLTVADLKPFHVQQWVDSYTHLSKTSRRNYFRTVKACIRWSLAQGYIEKDPLLGMQIPTGDIREVTIPQADFERLLAVITDQTFKELVLFTWETGCRPQESLRIEARHIDLPRQRIVFPKAEAKGKRQPRIIYLTDVALKIVQRNLAAHPEGILFRQTNGERWTPAKVVRQFEVIQVRMGREQFERLGQPVPQSLIDAIAAKKPRHRKSGQPLTDVQFRSEVRELAVRRHAKAFAPRYSLYALRHAWATRALESGVDALTVAILMGHSDPSTLARVYQHLSHNPEHMLAQLKRTTPAV